MKNYDNNQNYKNSLIKKAENFCLSNKLRLTTIRKRVLEIILESNKPSKAYDILKKIKGIGSEKPPTVYRALDFLLENGLIHKLNSNQSYISCQHPNEHSECFFLFCKVCKNISECCATELSRVFKKTVKKAKFTDTKIHCEIIGTCDKCCKIQ